MFGRYESAVGREEGGRLYPNLPVRCLYAQQMRQCHCNVSRDDKAAIELFLAGIRAWEADLRRQMNDAKPKLH